MWTDSKRDLKEIFYFISDFRPMLRNPATPLQAQHLKDNSQQWINTYVSHSSTIFCRQFNYCKTCGNNLFKLDLKYTIYFYPVSWSNVVNEDKDIASFFLKVSWRFKVILTQNLSHSFWKLCTCGMLVF